MARAHYLLSLTLHATYRFAEANKLRKEARVVLSELTGQHQSHIEENMRAYDSLVTVWNGRSFASKPLTKQEPLSYDLLRWVLYLLGVAWGEVVTLMGLGRFHAKQYNKGRGKNCYNQIICSRFTHLPTSFLKINSQLLRRF